MPKFLIVLATAWFGLACGERDRQNSAVCGFTLTAGAGRIIDQLANINAVLEHPPTALTAAGRVPTRAFGHPSIPSEVAAADTTFVTLEYSGSGFPAETSGGFGLAVVDDSSEIFRGVVIFDRAAPRGYPQIGILRQAERIVPLFGLRVRWSAVNDESCPIFLPHEEPEPESADPA